MFSSGCRCLLLLIVGQQLASWLPCNFIGFENLPVDLLSIVVDDALLSFEARFTSIAGLKIVVGEAYQLHGC